MKHRTVSNRSEIKQDLDYQRLKKNLEKSSPSDKMRFEKEMEIMKEKDVQQEIERGTGKKKQLGARIDPELYKKIRIIAAIRGVSIGTVVEEALRDKVQKSRDLLDL